MEFFVSAPDDAPTGQEGQDGQMVADDGQQEITVDDDRAGGHVHQVGQQLMLVSHANLQSDGSGQGMMVGECSSGANTYFR